MSIIDEALASVALDHDEQCGTRSLCGAMLRLADDYGDNVCTCHCQLPHGHDGMHMERGRGGHVVIRWDESEAVYGE